MKQWVKPHITRREGCWVVWFCGRGYIWRNTQDLVGTIFPQVKMIASYRDPRL